MEIGKLRTRVDVLSRVDIIDECGGSEASWAITRRIWGSVRDSYSHETTSAQGILGQTDAEIFARYNTFCLAEIGYDKKLYYGAFVELGTKKNAAHLFMRKAVDGNEHEITKDVVKEISDVVGRKI